MKIKFSALCKANVKYLRKKIFKPYIKCFCMRAILFYQKYLSKKRCPYKPSCSQYTLESINNNGVVLGICLGIWRILRCNPLTKGGFDPAPEKIFIKKWLI